MTAPPSHADPLGTDRDAALSLPPHDLAATPRDTIRAITVDKPPGSLWVMDLSARIFGMHGSVGGDGRFGGPGGGGFGGQHGGSSSSRQIAAWVQQNFTATRVGNAAAYDLTVEH